MRAERSTNSSDSAEQYAAVNAGRPGQPLQSGRSAAVYSVRPGAVRHGRHCEFQRMQPVGKLFDDMVHEVVVLGHLRSEGHTSELQSLMRISYAVFCLKKKKCSPKSTDHQYSST